MNNLIEIKHGELVLLDDAIERFTALTRARLEYNVMETKLKEELLQAMEENGIKSFDHPLMKAVYVAATTRNSVDTKALKEKYPWIAEELTKTTAVKSQVRLTIK